MNDLKTLYDEFNIMVKTKKYGHKYRSNLYLRKLGHMLMLFLGNLDSIHGHFIRFCGWLFVRCSLQSYIKRIKASDCVQSRLTNLSRIKEPIHHESAKSLRSSQYLIFSLPQGYCDGFVCEKIFFNVFVWGNLSCAKEPR